MFRLSLYFISSLQNGDSKCFTIVVLYDNSTILNRLSWIQIIQHSSPCAWDLETVTQQQVHCVISRHLAIRMATYTLSNLRVFEDVGAADVADGTGLAVESVWWVERGVFNYTSSLICLQAGLLPTTTNDYSHPQTLRKPEGKAMM